MTLSRTPSSLSIALYQPDIPQNTGTILRLAACLGMKVHIIEPTGFIISDKGLQRAGMDYLERAGMVRHRSWDAFENWREKEKRRLVLATTKTDKSYLSLEFQQDDILLFGRESSGVPEDVHEKADAEITIPMVEGLRSINLACSVAMVTGEALRQIKI